ncbi:MAG: NAD(+) synthase [Kiritimatiellae bacterium]|nr:NAD(+) synthase [Kiritimatiellia bacterium]
MNKELAKYLKETGNIGSLANRCVKGKFDSPFPCDPKDVFSTQVSGLVTRLKRTGIKSVTIGISGGLDSTLCLLVSYSAFRALKLPSANIHAYTMPGFGTTKRTKGNADKLCEGLGIKLETINITKACRQHFKDIGHDGKTPDVTFENAQARMRTLILMDKANMTGGIVLGTGDLSEIALGWCTYNGDHMSMFGVNSGVPKTVVRKVCDWWADETLKKPNHFGALKDSKKAALAIKDIIATPVSPELIKGQITENNIGPYELHDFFIWNFIMNGLDKKALLAAAKQFFKGTYDLATIKNTLGKFLYRLVAQAFKRNCAPDGIRVFPFDFSPTSWHIPSDLPPTALL